MLAAPLFALAIAGPAAPAIEWSAPPGCPGRIEVLGQAARIMGRPTLDERAGVSIRGRIDAEPVGFALVIELETPTGRTRKQAHAEQCAVLGNVAALMVAVAIDPVQAVTTRPVETAPREQLEPTAPPEPTAAPRTRSAAEQPAPSPRRTSWIEGLVRASGGVGRGLVPTLDGYLSLGAGVRTTRWKAEVVAFHVLAQTARYPALPSVGAEVAAWGGSLRAGPVFERGAIEVSTRVGLSVAALVATGFGVREPGQGASAWIAPCFVPGLRWKPSPRWALGLDVEGELALRRPAFALDALPTLHRASPVGVRGALVVELRLGSRGP